MDNDFLQNFGVKNPIVLDMVKKVMVNLNYERNYVQFRKLRDETTKHFTDVFVKNGSTYNFINYIYHKMNTHIISNINSEIIKYNETQNCKFQEFLKHDEEILFIFKGGTNMFLLKKHMDSQINQDLNNILRIRAHQEYARLHPTNMTEEDFVNQKLGEYTDSFNSNFDISDSDFTIYIICRDEKRYAFLYNIISRLLIEVLEEISLEMDDKLNQLNNRTENIAPINNGRIIPDNQPFAAQILNFDNDNTEDSLIKFYYEYKKIYVALFLDLVEPNDINKHRLVINYLNMISFKLLNNIYNDLAKLSLIKNTLTLIKYVHSQNNLNVSTILIDDVIRIVNEKISNELYENLTRIHDLYSIDKFIDFKRKLVNGLNNSIRKNGNPIIFNNYEQNNEELTGYRIMDNIVYNDIKIKKRKSSLLKNNNVLCPNIGLEMIDSREKKSHYITVNNVIFTNIPKAAHINSFDLYRIKLNVVLENRIINHNKYLIESTEPNKKIKVFNNSEFVENPTSINIPTEFIDVSIPKFNDYGIAIHREKYYNLENEHSIYEHFDVINVNPLENNITMKSILFYNYETMLDDLNFVLFKQNTFTCMFDSKFVKRLFRYLYFYLILLVRKAIESRTLPVIQYNSIINDIKQNINNITKLFEKLADYPVHNSKDLLEFVKPLYNNLHYNFVSNPVTFELIENNVIDGNILNYFKTNESYKNIDLLINHHFIFKKFIPKKDISEPLKNKLLAFLNVHLDYSNIIGYDGYHINFINDLYKLFDEEVIILKNISAYIASSIFNINIPRTGQRGGKSSTIMSPQLAPKGSTELYRKSSPQLASKGSRELYRKSSPLKEESLTLENGHKSLNKHLKREDKSPNKSQRKSLIENESLIFNFIKKMTIKNKENVINKKKNKNIISLYNIINDFKTINKSEKHCIKMNVSNLESPIIMNITSLGNDKKINSLIRKYINEGTKREKDRYGGLMSSVDDMDKISNGNIKNETKNKKLKIKIKN